MAADFYDALSQNTRATGQWGKGGPPKFQPYPRPNAKADTPEKKKPASVKDVFAKFKQFMPTKGTD